LKLCRITEHLLALNKAWKKHLGSWLNPFIPLAIERNGGQEPKVRGPVGERKTKMSQKDAIRRVLETKRKELLTGTSDRAEILIENAAEEFDRLQQQLNREVAIRNLDRESKLLKEVQAAISRLDDESFGVCLRCEEEIPEKRLKAVPWAAYCVSCQETVDKQRAAGEPVDEDAGSFELAAA
jgi:DnaK suppressor protein